MKKEKERKKKKTKTKEKKKKKEEWCVNNTWNFLLPRCVRFNKRWEKRNENEERARAADDKERPREKKERKKERNAPQGGENKQAACHYLSKLDEQKRRI